MQNLTIEKITSYTGKKLNLKTSGLYMNALLFKHMEIHYEDGKFMFRTLEAAKKLANDGYGKFIHILERVDVITAQTMHLMQMWKKDRFKNYIPSTPLVKVLKDIDVSMPCSQFKAGQQGYFELAHLNLEAPEKWSAMDKGVGFLLFKIVETHQGKLNLVFSYTMKDFSDSSSFCIPLEESDRDIREVVMEQDYTIPVKQGDKVVSAKCDIDSEDMALIRLALNLIIYISNPNEEFKTEFNNRRKLKRKAKRFIDYTEKGYIPLGFDAEFLRLVSTESFNVRGHWRWAAVGVGRMMRKLTFVKPHTRQYKDKLGE